MKGRIIVGFLVLSVETMMGLNTLFILEINKMMALANGLFMLGLFFCYILDLEGERK